MLAKYSAESRTWKKATIVSHDAVARSVTVVFAGYPDSTVLPAERVKACEAIPKKPRVTEKPKVQAKGRDPRRAPLRPATQIPRATSPCEQLLAKARACLSKLAPDNFEKLCAQIVELDIEGHATLAALVELMFERAIRETAFVEIYAKLFARCAHELPAVKDDATGEPTLTFRKLLLERAQAEFEGGGGSERGLTDHERRRKLGYTIFLGQLWLQGLLRDGIVHQCVRHLLSAAEHAGSDEEPSCKDPTAKSTELHADAVEVACTLIGVIGPAVDASGATGQAIVDEYVARMRGWATDKTKLPAARLRFKVMDVLDMRARKWAKKA